MLNTAECLYLNNTFISSLFDNQVAKCNEIIKIHFCHVPYLSVYVFRPALSLYNITVYLPHLLMLHVAFAKKIMPYHKSIYFLNSELTEFFSPIRRFALSTL